MHEVLQLFAPSVAILRLVYRVREAVVPAFLTVYWFARKFASCRSVRVGGVSVLCAYVPCVYVRCTPRGQETNRPSAGDGWVMHMHASVPVPTQLVGVFEGVCARC